MKSTGTSYAPRSPDLSGLQPNLSSQRQSTTSFSALPASSGPHRESFSLPQHTVFRAQPQTRLQPPQEFHASTVSLPQPRMQPQHSSLKSPTSNVQQIPHQTSVKYQHPDSPSQQPPLITHTPPAQPRSISKVQQALTELKAEDAKPAPGEAEGIVVKTKFPVARIKRIVQADEDVGKVAQVTPVVVSKALELFMISLALKSAAEARVQSSKRITAAHLKQAVAKDEQFDFLSEIVAKVADAPAPAPKQRERKRDSEGDGDDGAEEDAEVEEAPKRRKKSVKLEGTGSRGSRSRKVEREDT